MFKKKLIQLNTQRHKIQNRIIAKLFSRFFKQISVYGYGSDICIQNGFLPVPVHFYSPIPDIEDLKKRNIWDYKSNLLGLDFNSTDFLSLLKKLSEKYGSECNWPLIATKDKTDFFLDNDNFSFGCATALHTMIRDNKPKNVIEIGSGNSSKIISHALQLNKKNDNIQSSYAIVDPYPGELIKKGLIQYNKLYEERVELLQPNFFDILQKNDILFIDSSHTVKIGSDVNYLILQILPRLNPGVIIHVHDITIPYEYPKIYATSETFRQFWTEQYLLQAFLNFNKNFKILLPMYLLMTDHSSQFQKLFPQFNPKIHQLVSGSFWFKRVD